MEDKCTICNTSSGSIRSGVVGSDYFLPENYSIFLQKFSSLVPQFSKELNSICQELDLMAKKSEPIINKIIISWESFFQEKAGKSLKEFDVTKISLCENCLNQKERSKEEEWKEFASREKVRERFSNIEDNKIIPLLEKISNEIGKEKAIQIEKEAEKEVIVNINANIKKIIANIKEEVGVAGLEAEIQQLEQITNRTSQQNQKLKTLKEKLTKLKTQQETQKNDNSKLYWGLGLGALGISLIGLIIYLVLKNRSKE